MDFLDSRNAMSALVGIGRIAAASACHAWGRKGITIGTESQNVPRTEDPDRQFTVFGKLRLLELPNHVAD
ncbi:MAG: hypothetical protein ACJ8G7_13205 [Rhizobacter sp.]